MKGIALELPIIALIAIVVVSVSISLLLFFSGQFPSLKPSKTIVNVKYACVQYNEEKIDFDTFKTILYGFVTQQCTNFTANTTQKITIDDVKRSVADIDEDFQVIQISSCRLPEVDAKVVYFCCDNALEKNKIISIVRKNIYSNGVMICEK